jgi:hypothetical protein
MIQRMAECFRQRRVEGRVDAHRVRISIIKAESTPFLAVELEWRIVFPIPDAYAIAIAIAIIR